MANVRHNVPFHSDFARTGRMATTAFVVAAVLLGLVALLTVAYLSSRDAPQRGNSQQDQRLPVTR